MKEKLIKLEKIESAIRFGYVKIGILIENEKFYARQGMQKHQAKELSRISDLKRGIDRLKIAFNKELEKLKYD